MKKKCYKCKWKLADTTSVGVVDISATGMTSGSTLRITGGGANITSGGKVVKVAMGAATTGAGISVTTKEMVGIGIFICNKCSHELLKAAILCDYHNLQVRKRKV